jgi:ribosome-binding factor A
VTRRVADEIRMKLGELLVRETSDARLAGVHVTRVEMSKDLSVAHVWWRPTPGVAREGEAEEALERAARFLRSRLGRTMRLKHLPELDFELDALPGEPSRLDALLSGLAPRPMAVGDDDAPPAVGDDDSPAVVGADDSDE